MNIGIILLAGGTGTRMKSDIPKQFLPLNGKPIALHSFDLFLSMPEVAELVVVCAPKYRHLFSSTSIPLTFASPGERRQDSVYNGLQALSESCTLVGVHDSARPCITLPLVRRALHAAKEHGAATVGMPIKFTVKECNEQQFVKHTPDRSRIWEIQTPQFIQTSLLKQGFQHVKSTYSTVTDDVSIVELLGLPVKLVEGSQSNLKITTLEDLAIAQSFLERM
jgi:2-C-methyl-D-erythritol 4-phosphate cytidylyltransferase